MENLLLDSDDKLILAEALRVLFSKMVAPYCRGQYQKWLTVPKPSPEMVEFLRLVERLRLRVEGVELPPPVGPDTGADDGRDEAELSV